MLRASLQKQPSTNMVTLRIVHATRRRVSRSDALRLGSGWRQAESSAGAAQPRVDASISEAVTKRTTPTFTAFPSCL